MVGEYANEVIPLQCGVCAVENQQYPPNIILTPYDSNILSTWYYNMIIHIQIECPTMLPVANNVFLTGYST
jgi:hypothetical protein